MKISPASRVWGVRASVWVAMCLAACWTVCAASGAPPAAPTELGGPGNSGLPSLLDLVPGGALGETVAPASDAQGAQSAPLLTAELVADPQTAGDAILTVSLRVPAHRWTYSLNPQVPGHTRILLPTVVGLTPLDEFVADRPSTNVVEPLFDNAVLEKFYDQVTWTRHYRVIAPAQQLAGEVRFQHCGEDNCINDKASIALATALPVSTVPLPATTGPASDAKVATAPGTDTPATESAAAGADATLSAEQSQLLNSGLIPFLIAAFGFGFGALLTPCVFPMVPITVSVFMKQAEREHHSPIALALTYCGGIVGGFTVLGVLASLIISPSSLNEFANHPIFNLVLAAVLIFFGFNMLGMFEIAVPSWLLTWSAGQESRGGYVGVLFMALTFTLVSFTCTFGFVGFLLVMASKGQLFWPIVGMLAFSSAFALPFFFLALFPTYLKKLPKSGGWMNAIKVTMGLIEIAAAFKFLSAVDLAWNSYPVLFDYALVMSSWMVLSFVAGGYLLGLFHLAHDVPGAHISSLRFTFALLFLGFGSYLGVGLFSTEKPTGIVWQQVDAFAPPVFKSETSTDLGPTLVHDGLEFGLDFDRAVAHAQREGKPLFIDFTGENCVNCRRMEKSVFPKADVRSLLGGFVRVQLYADTDTIPGIADPATSRKLYERNLALQKDWLRDVTLPAYAVATPDGQIILSQLSGYHPEEEVFTTFLQTGLKKFNQSSVSANPPASGVVHR